MAIMQGQSNERRILMGKIALFFAIWSLFLTGCTPITTITPPKSSGDILVVPTDIDQITADSTWCPTFQLVWNDMKNEVVKQDVIFEPEQSKMAENLNQETFKADMLSDDYYYKKWGLKSLALKEEIERGIKQKFNEKSDILDDFDWSEKGLNDPNNPNLDIYFFYSMLKREFSFEKEFEKLKNGTFGKETKTQNVKYFGIQKEKDARILSQVDVLFYNEADDEYAVSLKTKSGDEVILYKSPKGNTFSEIYQNLTEKSEKYEGNRRFQKVDELKVPYINIDRKENYPELTNKPFFTATGNQAMISQAVQTIQFELNEKGGKIKSEAAIEMKVNSIAPAMDRPVPRYFYFDDTFALFLKEENKDTPYFGAVIGDIAKFQ